MVTTPVLFDTCILIDYLRGIPQARTECDRHADRAISIITWMEVLAGATASEEDRTRMFLRNFHPVALTAEVAEHAAAIRRTTKIKLPDAIIQATAEVEGRTLITRNTRDFSAGARGIRVPYVV
jgi:hypothetical protein